MSRRPWFERQFPQGLDPRALPDLVERLRGTPGRLEERLGVVAASAPIEPAAPAWSVASHAGHLGDLEPLWSGRVDDILAGVEVMRPADLTNRATEEADHDSRSLPELAQRFRDSRSGLVERLEGLASAEAARTALHPRLRQPMSLVDLAFFVSEHDDHHLAAITALLPKRS